MPTKFVTERLTAVQVYPDKSNVAEAEHPAVEQLTPSLSCIELPGVLVGAPVGLDVGVFVGVGVCIVKRVGIDVIVEIGVIVGLVVGGEHTSALQSHPVQSQP